MISNSPESEESNNLYRTPSSTPRSALSSPSGKKKKTSKLNDLRTPSKSSYYEQMKKKKLTNSVMSEENEHTDNLSLSIIEYYRVSDGYSFDEHVFIVRVQYDEFDFSIHRSYLDFVELIRRLRKSFPFFRLVGDDSIPLASYHLVEKEIIDHIGNSVSSKHQRSNSLTIRNSLAVRQDLMIGNARNSVYLASGPPSKQFVIPQNALLAENISTLAPVLERYLRSLIEHQEVLTSDDFLTFLDEEVTSMTNPETAQESLNAHDILLLNVPISRCTVKANKGEDFHFSVPSGHMIIWRFSTEGFDIAFSVEMNNVVKVPYTRYKSQERIIYGSLEAHVHSLCALKFDNSYSKLRSKSLCWASAVVSVEAYQAASDQAMECRRESRRFEQQRLTLRRLCVQRAALLTGVIHGCVLEHDFAQEELDYVRLLESEVCRLSEQEAVLLADVERSEATIEELTAKASADQKSQELLSSSWNFTISQLDNSQKELRDKTVENEALLEEGRKKDEMIALLQMQLQKSRELLYVASAEVDEIRQVCDNSMSETQKDWFKLNQDIRSLRREWSRLQNGYASKLLGNGSTHESENNNNDNINDNISTESLYREGDLGPLPECVQLVESMFESLECARSIVEKKNDALYSVLTKAETIKLKSTEGSPNKRNSSTSTPTSPHSDLEIAFPESF